MRTTERTEWVCDAVPGARQRPAADTDACMHVNDDGTVTIPPDVEVVEVEGDDAVLWFRCPRLRGWAGHHKQSPIMADPSRSLVVAVAEELERQGRTVTRWSMAQANAARDAEIARWRKESSHD